MKPAWALCLGGVLGVWASLTFSPLYCSGKGNHKENVRAKQHQVAGQTLFIIDQTIDSSEGQRYSNGDQQKSQSWWQRTVRDPIASLTGLIFIVYLGLFYVGLRQIRESKTTAEEDRRLLRRQLEAYERPWITASVKVEGLVTLFQDGRISLPLTPVITNIGKSVAIDLDYRLELVRLTVWDDVQTLPGRIEAIQRARPPGSGFAIFPSGVADDLLWVYDLPPTPDDPNPIPRQWAETFACIGAVFYRFANSDMEHDTRFACALRIDAFDRITEHLNHGIHDMALAAEDVQVVPQVHMTRAT